MLFGFRSMNIMLFTKEKIHDNAAELIHTVVKMKPATAKGTYLKSVYMASSMSPAIMIDTKLLTN